MSCDQYTEAIVELVDGTLDAAARERVAAHLETCAACRTLADDLRRIEKAARELEPVEPPARVWRELSSALAGGHAGVHDGRARSWFVQPRWLAVAASLLLAAGVTLVLLLRAGPEPSPATGGPGTLSVSDNVNVGDLVESIEAELTLAEEHYRVALENLERIAAAEDGPIEPAVTLALRSNVELVDRAIADSRSALQQQPESVPARESLFEALRRKVGLLQETIALVGEMSRGNQAGAAEIAEGLKKS